MNKWMNEWMDGWMNGWMNKWMNEWMRRKEEFIVYTVVLKNWNSLAK